MQKIKIINYKDEKILVGNVKPFLLGSIENLASNSSNVYSSINAGQDGISIDNITMKERLLAITAIIVAQDKKDLHRKRAYLSSFFNPKNKFTLIYTDNAKTKKISGIIQSVTFKNTVNVTQQFLIQFLCPNPYWHDLKEEKTAISLWQGDFQFPLQIKNSGIEMGHRVSNLICNVINNGDIQCPIRIKFKALGTVINPSLFNINTREFIKINKDLHAGDVLEINTDSENTKIELLLSNGTRENVFNWLHLDSEFLKLNVGDNLFRYNADKGLDNLEVSIYHSSLYLGV